VSGQVQVTAIGAGAVADDQAAVRNDVGSQGHEDAGSDLVADLCSLLE
jgi:hypothetical protein